MKLCDWDCRITLEGELPNTWGMLSEFESTWHADKAKMAMRASRIQIDVRLEAADEVHATELALKLVREAKAARQVPAHFDVGELTVRSTA